MFEMRLLQSNGSYPDSFLRGGDAISKELKRLEKAEIAEKIWAS